MPDINIILQDADLKKVVEKLCVDTKEDRNPIEYLEEYKGKRERRETSVGFREDKLIDIYSDTETTINEDGEEVPKKIGTDIVNVAKIHTNIPKKIVRTAVAFLFGGQMSMSFNEENEGTEYFRSIFSKSLKMRSVFKEFARTVMIETKSALLFFPFTNDDGEIEIRVRVLSQKNGEFFPHFNDFGKMDGFIRRYKAIDPEDEKEYENVWIQTDTDNITLVNKGGWVIANKEPNLFKKVSVVYAEQDDPEWEEVTSPMDAVEMRISRLFDTNDYFSEPILKSYGATNLPSKKTVGKQIEFEVKVDPDTGKEYHGDADYLTWQQSVESIKLELDKNIDETFSGSSTPNLSFENLKGIDNISGIGMKFMFMDAYMKADEKMEIFEPAVQRAVHIVFAGIIEISNPEFRSDLEDNDCEVTFGSILPDDLREEMEVLSIANGNKPINSRRTVTARSRFTANVDEEMKLIEEEESADANRSNLLGGNQF